MLAEREGMLEVGAAWKQAVIGILHVHNLVCFSIWETSDTSPRVVDK